MRLIAVVAEGNDEREAEDAFEQLFNKLKPATQALLHEESGALPLRQMNFWMWLRAFKLDLDEITFAGTAAAEHSLPDY